MRILVTVVLLLSFAASRIGALGLLTEEPRLCQDADNLCDHDAAPALLGGVVSVKRSPIVGWTLAPAPAPFALAPALLRPRNLSPPLPA